MGEEGPRGSTASFPRDSGVFADRRHHGDALPCAEGPRLHMGGFQRCCALGRFRMISRIFREWVLVECAAPSDRPRCCTVDWPRPGRSPPPWGQSTSIIRFIRSRGPLGGRPGRDLTADPDRSSAWAAASLRFDPDQVPNAPRAPCVSVGPGSSPVGLAPGARNGALGGSFRSALDRAAARTAQSRGNSRAHPGCRPERSSQSARTGGQRGPSARRRRGPR